MTDEILTIREVATLLKIGEKTTYTMAQLEDFPEFKVWGQWRFRRSNIDAWIHERVEKQTDGAEAPDLELNN